MLRLQDAQKNIPEYQIGWRSKLREASFRGITFKVELSESGFGRRIKRRNRWQKQPVTQDMGPELDTFRIIGYIVAEVDVEETLQAVNVGIERDAYDYFKQRDKLIAALKARKHGTLVHPFLSKEIKCHVEGQGKFTETFNEGQGICKFEILFVADGPSVFPGSALNHTVLVDDAATNLTDVASDNFLDSFLSDLAFITSTINDAIATMQNVQNAVNSIRNAISGTIASAVGFIAATISIIGNLIDTPCQLFNAFTDATSAVTGIVGIGDDVLQGGIIGGCSGVERGDTFTLDGSSIPEKLGVSTVEALVIGSTIDEDDLSGGTETQSGNRQLIVNANKITTLAGACQCAIRIEFSSQTLLLDIMNLVAGALDSLLDRFGSDIDGNGEVFTATDNLRSVFVTSMLDIAEGVTREIDYTTPPDIKSTLEISYDKYLDLNRAEDIFARNNKRSDINFKHPGFVPENQNIKILDDFASVAD